MRVLLNTLYVTTPDAYLALDGENVVVNKGGEILGRVPLHNLQGIIGFGYTGASPALMGKCARYGIGLSFLSMHGNFLARVVGETNGNVLLRREQYRIADDSERSLELAKSFITGKLYNSKWIVERTLRDYGMRVEAEALEKASRLLKQAMVQTQECVSYQQLLGVEGEGAAAYFGVFDQMILRQKEEFAFHGRSRRPPLDRVNALLSFTYTLLAHDAASALEGVGLDAYVGFYHTDRPGRVSLALDLMEEFRSVMADRFVLSMINRKQIQEDGFSIQENGAVLMDDVLRKRVLSLWQERKQETLTHPFLGEKIPWGLAMHVQAQLLARFIRGDIDGYPPFLWK